MTSVRGTTRERRQTGDFLSCRIVAAILTLTLAALLAAIGMPAPIAAQTSKAVEWARYDVSLVLREDGSYHVEERMEVDFLGGPFRGGFATIPLERVERIANVNLTETGPGGEIDYQAISPDDYEEDPQTFTASVTSTEIQIEWGFEPTSNETRTFVLAYDVAGALRVYYDNDPPNQQIWWTAVNSDVTEVAPVRESLVTVTLPQAVPLEEVRVGKSGEDDPSLYTDDGQIFTWQRSDLDAGDSFEVRLQFPPLVNAAPPAWQQTDDDRRRDDEEREDRGALLNFMFLGIGLLSAVLGGVGVYGLWYTRGRDPHAGPIADFLPAPPDDLPPGAAGVLVDEVAHERDIVATLVDLGNRGIIKIDEVADEGILGFGGGRDFTLRLEKADAELSSFEQQLVHALFGSSLKAGVEVKLSSVKSRFTQAQKTIKDAMYEELVKRGYFPRSPESTRTSYRGFAIGMLVAVGIGGGMIAGDVSDIAPLIWFVVVVLALVAVVLIGVARTMPRKTLPGAEAAAKWRAFRRYLEEIDRYEKLDEAKGIFDKYLPYAIAFDLEQSWVRKFASVGTPAPTWYGEPGGWAGDTYPRRSQRRRGPVIVGGDYGPGSERDRGGGGSGGGGVDFPDLPDLQDMSDSAGRSLQSSSKGLFDMFNSASRAFGGFSGGSRGGGGWGGGRGFGGGGSRGGSSGGGRRGFR